MELSFLMATGSLLGAKSHDRVRALSKLLKNDWIPSCCFLGGVSSFHSVAPKPPVLIGFANTVDEIIRDVHV